MGFRDRLLASQRFIADQVLPVLALLAALAFAVFYVYACIETKGGQVEPGQEEVCRAMLDDLISDPSHDEGLEAAYDEECR